MNSYDKLNSLINQIDQMIRISATQFSSDFQAWHKKCIRFLSNTFGENSIEFKEFKKQNFGLMISTDETTTIDYVRAMKSSLIAAKAYLLDILSDLEPEDNAVNNNDKNKKDKVFIVHGHDSALKYQVSNLLRKVGIPPIILHEQINSSDTIIEKLERCGAEAAAAVILFTPDDFGQAKTDEERRQRARQNVVFEAGYFMGLLGRDKTILIVTDNTIELPGDLSGVVYSSEQSVEISIAAELKKMGLPVDLNKLYE